ncbi:ectoine hydroxylase [Allokutzneria albata]|uniref:Ectoine hydroxylase n=1 Tax=Allokutzneria albata TaxID=211114 RepID=A0A1H0AR54_ALLAB|nr:ectoine hydroxylase [Allokutzneria albata]
MTTIDTLPGSIVEDRYPTRCKNYPMMLRRPDPVVWPTESGTTAAGPIDADTVSDYDARGFLTIDSLLSPDEVALYRDELDRLAADPAVKADERTVVEKTSNEVRSIFEVHRISPAIAELVRDPRVVDRARQLLGSDVYVHQSRINYKPGFKGGSFYWHSDFETWHAEDGMPAMRAVSISIALTDNHPFNGGLMIMPGSHRTFVSCVGETPADHYKESLREQEIGTPDNDSLTVLAGRYGIEQFTGPAGSAVMFDSNCMHGSNGNITPFPRSNIFVVFNSVENTLVEPFAAPQPRPPFIASRDFTPVGRE